MSEVEFKINQPISADQFTAVLKASTLGERRPIENEACVQGMLDNANLTLTAWDADRLIGIARSVTDFHYCCYVSDLAVDQKYQKRGIGKQLLRLTKHQLMPTCMLILLSAPAAVEYYPHLGFERHPQAYLLRPGDQIK